MPTPAHSCHRYGVLWVTIAATPLLVAAAAATPVLGRSRAETTAPALMHLHLVKSAPASGASLARSPGEIRLIFSTPVTLASLDMRDSAGQRITLGPVSLSVSPRLTIGKDSALRNAGVVVATVRQSLKPGVYRVAWKATGGDGHAVRNRFAFTVTAPAPSPAPAAKGRRTAPTTPSTPAYRRRTPN